MVKSYIARTRLFLVSSLFISTTVYVTAADLKNDELSIQLITSQEVQLSPRSFNLKRSTGESLKWIKDREKAKKMKFSLQTINIPSKVDFSDELPPLHDQGELGSCTAQAITLAMEYDLKQANNYTLLSPLYVYYNERELEGTVDEDAGASIADGIKSICVDGACTESTWSYEDRSNKFKEKPPHYAYEEGQNFLNLDNIGHSRIPHNLNALKLVLATRVPVVFGVMVYPSFISAHTGDIPMPEASESPLGGHAMTLIGYDDDTQKFKFANSWGNSWGDNGFGYLTYDYIMNKGSDENQLLTFQDEFWSISKIGQRV